MFERHREWCSCKYTEDPIIAERHRINAARERHYAETEERRAVLVRDLQFIYRTMARKLPPKSRAAFLELANHLENFK